MTTKSESIKYLRLQLDTHLPSKNHIQLFVSNVSSNAYIIPYILIPKNYFLLPIFIQGIIMV